MDTDRRRSQDQSLDEHVASGFAWRMPVLAAVTVAMALGSGPALSPVAAATPTEAMAQGSGWLGNSNGDADVKWGDDDTHESAQATLAGQYLPQLDLSSMYSLNRRIGAQKAWSRGFTGAGVTVAMIDTGVTRVRGLGGDDKVVNGPDLSYESQRPGTRYRDGFGHGTHMAGIVAGRDGDFRLGLPNPSSFGGVAPNAQVLNMKVATGDGGADVTSVIAAIDWVVQHQRDEKMNVRVINLAYGTDSTQGADVDPLARAVENAWKAGIVVVAAAGNDGFDGGSLLMPAADPYVIAVGAVDHRGTGTLADDVVADFSNAGNDGRRPDLLAPGKSVVSLRVPHSYVDELYPEGLIDSDTEQRYLRGSGTSQATAVVSGAVALLLQQRPAQTPDQVKAILRTSADPLAVADPAQGAGVLDVDGALDTAKPVADAVRQTWPMSTGLGSLDAARGGEYVIDPMTGDLLTGQVDALGDPFDSAAWVAESTAGTAWSGGTWTISRWTGNSWVDRGWAPTTWSGSSWSGMLWTDHLWSEAYWEANSWRDDSWLASSWRGGTWAARSWRADSWLASSWREGWWMANSWRDSAWEANSWRDAEWLASSWRADSWIASSWRALM